MVDLDEVVLGNLGKTIVSSSLGRVGLSLDWLGKPPGGYYLFCNRQLVAFHAGSIDLASDGMLLAAGVIGAVLALSVDMPALATLGTAAATWNGAVRAVDYFETFLRNAPFTAQAQRPPQPAAETPAEKLLKAYRELELPRGAADQEVIEAHRRLTLIHHPDRRARDPSAVKAATERMTRIECGPDTILGRPR